MKPTKFPFFNITFAKDQPGFSPLPAWTNGKLVVSRWTLSWRERFHVLFTGVVWARQMPFGRPLQALNLQAQNPFPKMPLVKNDNLKPVGKPAESKL